MATWKDLADLLFPNVDADIQKLLDQYPPRENPICTRFAPSPTGFLHFWGVFTSVLNCKYAKQQGGTFFLRIEDTDQKREVEGAVSLLIRGLKYFGIEFDEGPIGENGEDVGNYGPYTQSKRGEYYKVFIKNLIERGLAYPCWMSEEELNAIREKQMAQKKLPGIYGEYSKYRAYTPDQLIETYHENGDTFPVIRFRSPGDLEKKILFTDELRGVVSMADNYNDIVILKKDGLPTYHLAHIVDDTLMRTSLVMRGEEWLTSVPLHLQLFKAFDLPAPKYLHPAPISKLDEGKKRKLSKRHDPEADIQYFFRNGYAKQGILDYIFTLASSSFEDWRKEHQGVSLDEFSFEISKMGLAAPLFDETKLKWINNQYLSFISTEELYQQCLEWAQEYDSDFYTLLTSDPDYYKAAMNIERHTEKDPKRFTLYADVKSQILFFSDAYWNEKKEERKNLIAELGLQNLSEFVREYCEIVDLETEDTMVRFTQLKEIGKKYGYATNNAEFKQGGFVGKVGDLAMFLRVQLCGAKQTPDLFSTMKVMGKERVKERLGEFLV